MQIFSKITNKINKYGNVNYMKIISSSETKSLTCGKLVMFQYKNLQSEKDAQPPFQSVTDEI